MAKKSDGEVEVMLSDRQLILLFFVGVVLLAAFFAMGFVVGKRWASPAPAGPPVAQRPAGEALSKMAESLQKPKPAPAPPADQPGGVPTPPAAGETAAAAPKAAQPAGDVRDVVQPPRGTVFLQVSAQDLVNARIMTDSLRQRGFRSLIAPGPTADVFRVLVGPLESAEEVARTRTELKAAGFDPIVRKY